MRFYVISDNIDTTIGMRLAGIEGTVVHNKTELLKAMEDILLDKEIGIVLITEKASGLYPEYIAEHKLSISRPLVLEIPDRHGSGRTKGAITAYIKEAIGVKI